MSTSRLKHRGGLIVGLAVWLALAAADSLRASSGGHAAKKPDAHAAKKTGGHGAKKPDAHGAKKSGGHDAHAPAKPAAAKPVAKDPLDAKDLLERLNADRRRHDPNVFVEVDLGRYLATHRRREGELVHVGFQIYAVVHEVQVSELTTALEKRGKRLRDSVLATVQRCESGHLYDAKLEWLKSEFLPTINKILQTRVVRDIVFSEYSVERG